MNKDESILEQTASSKEITSPLNSVAFPESKTEVQTSITLENQLETCTGGFGQLQQTGYASSQRQAIDHTSQQMVNSSPSSEMNKDESIPEQTAPSKEETNPLKAGAFPESKIEVQTSITLVKPSDLNLRPDGGIQIPAKTKVQTSAIPTGYKGPKAYYVVFNGSNADKKNVSYFNFNPNADPDMIYEAYQYGLLAQVYPANNLLEISKFPKEFRKTVGFAKEKIYSPSKAMEPTLEKEDLREFAENKLLSLIRLSEEDYNKVVAFRRQLLHKDTVGAHKEIFCRKKQKEVNKFGIQLECHICGIITPDKESGKRIIEDPSTSAKDKEFLPKTEILYKAKPGSRF
uniref:Uncharacterized protein n=1 Tax=Daucus carota subsp. sativus TaxID=79200 RepID=A0A161ZHI8_DAUCS